MARKPKRKLFPTAASDEATLSDIEVHAADQERDGPDEVAGDGIYSSDEIGENGVLLKRQPPPKSKAAKKLRDKNAASLKKKAKAKRKAAKSLLRKKNKKGKAAAAAPVARNVSPSPEAGVERDVPQPQEHEYGADKHFKEKSQSYPHLWQMVQSLEMDLSVSFKAAFIKIDDTQANILNTRLKETLVQELKDDLWWKDNDKKLTELLISLTELMA